MLRAYNGGQITDQGWNYGWNCKGLHTNKVECIRSREYAQKDECPQEASHLSAPNPHHSIVTKDRSASSFGEGIRNMERNKDIRSAKYWRSQEGHRKRPGD
jgi:hypothetical protein